LKGIEKQIAPGNPVPEVGGPLRMLDSQRETSFRGRKGRVIFRGSPSGRVAQLRFLYQRSPPPAVLV